MDLKKTFSSIFNQKQDRKETEAAVLRMVNAIKNQRSLFKKEIRDWKLARQAALNPDRPRRNLMINLIEDILSDAFIYGRTETRKLRISNKGFVIVNSKGEIDPDKTRLLEKQWFNQFIKIGVESIYYAYSLIYPKELDENGYIKKIALVYRDHIVPETQEILKEVSDDTGIKFTEGAYKKWMLFINYEGFLGLLDKAAPLWIFKKHSWQNWDEFEEMFGIPLRTAKVASQDKRVQAEVDKWLKDLGSAAYARFPEGVEIDIKESKSRDSFNVFNEKRKACNEELATLIDGNFETAKDTGSRAKAEAIINSTQALVELDDEIRLQFIINDELLPWLRELGYPFDEGDMFQWNYNEQATPKERLEIFKGVKDLGYRVKKEQIETELDVELEDDDDPKPEKKEDPQKLEARAGFKPPHAHHVGCGCGACAITYRRIDVELLADLSSEEEELLNQIYNDPDSVQWSYNEFKATHTKLLEALKEGFGAIDFDFESPDHLTMELFQANIHRFGVDKTFREIMDLNEILKTSEDFSEFRQRAKKLFPNYKEKWLRSEYNQAWAVSQMGARYIEMMRDIDIAPYWKLVAVLDDRTTEMCDNLDGKVFRKDDKKTWQFLPPNHWGCRSDAQDVLASYSGKISTFQDAVAAYPQGYERMVNAGFDVNWGDAGEVFTAAQNYLDKAGAQPPDVLDFDFSAFGLDAFNKIKGKAQPGKLFSFDRHTDRSGMARITDVRDMPAWISRDLFDELDKELKKGIYDLFENPDEIYWYVENSINVNRFLKFYEGFAFQALVTFSASNRATVVDILKISDPDTVRKGLLVYTKKEYIALQLQKYNSYGAEYKKYGLINETGAYVVAHKKHNKGELKNNLITAKLLRNIGKSVELLPVWENKSADAKVNGIEWEFKFLTNYTNLFNRVKAELSRGSKQCENVLLHINGRFSYKDLIRALNAGINNDKKKRIKFVGILIGNRFYRFSRKQIETREFEQILLKK